MCLSENGSGLCERGVFCVSFSTCQWVGGGHGPLVNRLRMTKNESSLFENESSIRCVNQQLPVGGVGLE